MKNISEINVSPSIDFNPSFLEEMISEIPTLKNSKEYKGYTIKYDFSFKRDMIGIENVGFIVLKQTINPKGARVFRFSYVKPGYRGKSIRNMLLEFAIKELGIKPIISDDNISISSAKNYLKLIKNTDLSVSIYNKDTKEKIPYTDEQNFLHSFDKELNFTNRSTNYKDGKKLVLMFENNEHPKSLTKLNEIYVNNFDIKILTNNQMLTESEILKEQELYENFLTSIKQYLGQNYNKTINDISTTISDAKSAVILIKEIINNADLLEKVNAQLGKQIRTLVKYINKNINEVLDKILNEDVKIKIVKIVKTVIGYVTKYVTLSGWKGFISRLGIYGFVKFISDKFTDLQNINDMVKTGLLDNIVEKVTDLSSILVNATIQSFLSFFSSLTTIKKYFLDILTYIRIKISFVVINNSIDEAIDLIEGIYDDVDQINEIYIGDFGLDDLEVGMYFRKLKKLPGKMINSHNDYNIKTVKYNNTSIIGIEDIGFIVIEKQSNLKYLQWTRSFIKPEFRGKNLIPVFLKTALSQGLRPLLSDYTFSIMRAKNFEKILQNSEFSVKIYDTEDDIILPYEKTAKIYHSPEVSFDSSHVGANLEQAEKYVWLIEHSVKDAVNTFAEDLNNMIKQLKTHVPPIAEDISFNFYDNNKESIKEAELNIKNYYNKKLKDNNIITRFNELYKEYNADYNKDFLEDANIFLKDDLSIIHETYIKELDRLINQCIAQPGVNYILISTLTLDDNGKAIKLKILPNKSKEKINFTTNNIQSKISFNYQEEIKNLLIQIKLIFGDEYAVYLEGIPVDELKRNIKEGGGAFKHPEFEGKIRRIKREEIDKTLRYIANNITNHTTMDYEYLKNNMMGSAGKQADSGDLDIAVDEKHASRETLVSISDKVKNLFTQNYSRTDGLNAGQLNTLIPIEGDEEKGLIQVDFIIGNPEWLKFTHHSPGADVSPFKGVFISQALGVIAKMKKIWEHLDENGERVGRIGWAYDLEKGLYIRPQVRKKLGQGMTKVSADEFESFPWHKYNANPPRVPRVGYINNPEETVKILLGKNVKLSDINTFEKLLKISKKVMRDKYPVFLERLKTSLKRSSAQAGMPKIAIDDLDIFK